METIGRTRTGQNRFMHSRKAWVQASGKVVLVRAFPKGPRAQILETLALK